MGPSYEQDSRRPIDCLVVSAHPLPDSLCGRLTNAVLGELEEYGWTIERLDLYEAGFSPALTARERASYYRTEFDKAALEAELNRLCKAEVLVIVFPTWWFGFPAILKGWFDRVWAPGAAFDHADDLGAIKPRLSRLRWVLAVTTLGCPAWVDRLVLWRPVRRILRTALVRTCAPQAGFSMKTLYRAEKVEPARIGAFEDSVRSAMRRISRRVS